VKIVSDRFKGLRTIARHQLVYRSLGPLMRSDIHALGIVALTPDEAL
jgi:BolA protein